MNFTVMPPELNSVRLFAGPGPAPMLAAAAGWDELAEELSTAAASFEAVTSGLAGGSWQGPASAAIASYHAAASAAVANLAPWPALVMGTVFSPPTPMPSRA